MQLRRRSEGSLRFSLQELGSPARSRAGPLSSPAHVRGSSCNSLSFELGSASLRVLFCKADGRVVLGANEWDDGAPRCANVPHPVTAVSSWNTPHQDASSGERVPEGEGVPEATKTTRRQGLGVRCLARQMMRGDELV